MVPTVLLGYFVLLCAVLLVVTGAVAWYWGLAMVAAFVALERMFFRNAHTTDGDDELDKQHDGHLPGHEPYVPPPVPRDDPNDHAPRP